VKTANTVTIASTSDRFAVDAHTGATTGAFAVAATVHRY
jgi:hypothetical protein